MSLWRCAVVVGLLSCTSPPATAPAPVAPRAVAPPDPSVVDDIPGALLRSVLVDGEVRLTVDDAIRAELREYARVFATTTVSICLDTRGAATVTAGRSSTLPSFDRAALALVSTWRFRAFERDGVAIPVCSEAKFQLFNADKLPPGVPPPPPIDDMLEGLNGPAVELPANELVANQLRPGATTVPPVPGVALMVSCHTPGAQTAPRVFLLQSSGDDAVDRRLLTARGLRFLDEKPGPPRCRVHARGRPTGLPPPEPLPVYEEPTDLPDPGKVRALEQQRIAGTRNVMPSDDVKRAMAARGVSQLLVPVKVCIDRAGNVTSVSIMKSSGHPAYDADLINAVYAWRYRPMLIDGKPVPVCSAIQFVYRQRPPSP